MTDALEGEGMSAERAKAIVAVARWKKYGKAKMAKFSAAGRTRAKK